MNDEKDFSNSLKDSLFLSYLAYLADTQPGKEEREEKAKEAVLNYLLDRYGVC